MAQNTNYSGGESKSSKSSIQSSVLFAFLLVDCEFGTGTFFSFVLLCNDQLYVIIQRFQQMNSNEDWGNRGANIIPSARPSIHDHDSCLFATSTVQNMVRYGVDDGVDVVDNAMSKQSEPINPSMFETYKTSPSIQNGLRRNSFNNDNKNYTDDDVNLLSKSAPATLPSQLRYSDDSDDDQNPVQNRNLNESFHSLNGSPIINRNGSASNVSLTNESVELTREKSGQSIKLVLPLISLVVLFASIYMKLYMNADEGSKVVYDEFMFYSDIVDLGHRYNVDENDVLKVQTGISTIFKRQDVGSFVFVYNSDTEDFDKNAFNKFMNEVSFTASKYLRNDTMPLRYILVEGKDLNNMEEHSEVMCKFREDLRRSGVMLVKDIEAVPSSLAMAFHYFCDEYNPLVKKSAIFFTIDLAKCSKEREKAKYAAIENCLAKKWNGIPADSIGPLLARVVNIIVDVTDVF